MLVFKPLFAVFKMCCSIGGFFLSCYRKKHQDHKKSSKLNKNDQKSSRSSKIIKNQQKHQTSSKIIKNDQK
jgi:hypothetical protein